MVLGSNPNRGAKFIAMENKYFLTEDQFEQLEYFNRMFETKSEWIKELCSTEKADINYGFELGKMHNYLRDNNIEFLHLCQEIKDQKIVPGNLEVSAE